MNGRGMDLSDLETNKMCSGHGNKLSGFGKCKEFEFLINC
jgi:hypothetical protein